MKGSQYAENLRGRKAIIQYEWPRRRKVRQHRVTVITHLRGTLWLVEGSTLPVARRYNGKRRDTIDESMIVKVLP